jgi:uncharacterized protein (TIGR01777 family)
LRLFVTGASGLVGRALARELSQEHELVGLSRQQQESDDVSWVVGDPCEPGHWTEEACAADAVVHLAGESVASGRWTRARKRELVRSRVESTRHLVGAFASSQRRPRVFVCASACGYYGARGEEELDESSPPGRGFLAELCADWESEADRARDHGIRVVKLRFGAVLSRHGGALAQMLPIFRLGLGGPLGPARRWFPWLAEDDAVGLLRLAIEGEVSGPLNGVSPGPVRMGELAKTLGRVLHRPALLPVPEIALALALGEMGTSLVPGQRVRPAAALRAGYAFRQPNLEAALRSQLPG